jgi:phage recombination protein Bet
MGEELMSNDLIASNNGALAEYTNEQLDLIKSQIAKDCTDLELKYFLEICKQTKLNPFMKQIYAIKRQTKNGPVMNIQCSIDGYRAIAHRTEKCLGIGDPKFTYGKNDNIPESATIIVKKLVGNHIGDFVATAYWEDYYGDGKSLMANSKPRIMLAKCAEVLALKKAFSAELIDIQPEYKAPEKKENKSKIDSQISDMKKDIQEELFQSVKLISANVNAVWSKLSEDQRQHLLTNILKAKDSNDLSDKSLSEIREIHSEFVDYIDSLKISL